MCFKMYTAYIISCCFVIVCCIFIREATSSGTVKYPVVLVPGDGGSQYEGKLDKPSVVHIWCTKKTKDWFQLWLNIELLAPFVVDCFSDNMRLHYDPATHTTSNSLGVQTRQPGFGNTSTVEWLDASHFPHTAYFYTIAQDLVDNLNYVRGKSIRGAPYDFRKAPNENKDYVQNLVKLVEDTYSENNGARVVMIGHSMGNPYILYLLYQQSQAWKDKYIHSFISLAGPWGGAAKVMRLFASGDDLGVFLVNPLAARKEQRSMPSSAWLLPYDTFWNDTEILVQSPTYNYTVKDYEKFFKDINYTAGYMMRQDTVGLLGNLQAPGVEVHCLHGHGVKTPLSLIYSKSEWYNNQPDVIFGDGDGTVNKRSLYGCLRWDGKQKQKVLHKAFPGADHMQILHNEDAIAYIRQVLSS